MTMTEELLMNIFIRAKRHDDMIVNVHGSCSKGMSYSSLYLAGVAQKNIPFALGTRVWHTPDEMIKDLDEFERRNPQRGFCIFHG